MSSVSVFAPATVANVAVGFDILGFSFPAVGDTVTVSRSTQLGVAIDGIEAPFNLPTDPSKNAATVGLLKLCEELRLPFGFRVKIKKGIPLGSGMGGSAASSVGALVAANALLPQPLSKEKLFKYTLEGERATSGAAHPDNAAPCLFGGLVVALGEGRIIRLPIPTGIYCVLAHPEIEVPTREARKILKPEVPLASFVAQTGHLAGFIAACFRNDLELIRQTLKDLIIEPQRKHLIPGLENVKSIALQGGALGCSISGSGPSVFAWFQDRHMAERAADRMRKAFLEAGLSQAETWISPLSDDGAKILV